MNVAAIRRDFPILARQVHHHPLIYLDNAATVQKPRVVIDRIVDFYTHKASNVHRGTHALAEEAGQEYEEARDCVRTFIGAAERSEVIFTRGATESINLVAASFGERFVQAGDEILVTIAEHHSNLLPWQILCQRKGARLRAIPIDDEGQLHLDALEGLLSDRTRLLAVTHVSNVTGIINPVEKIVALGHARGVPVLIDGAQAIAHVPVDVGALDCDFYAFSGHKVYAENGIGVLYAKKRWLDAMPPYQFGGGMIAHVQLDEARFLEPPFKFEAGTMNVAGALSLAEALKYVTGIGLLDIELHEKRLLTRFENGLALVGRAVVYGHAPGRSSCLSFGLRGVHHADVGLVLDKMGIAVRTGTHCAEPLMRHFGIPGTIRASVAVYNTEDEIDFLLDGLQRAADLLAG